MPHIPGHQGDPPGVYKPRMQITDKGSTALEQEPYVPIDTDVIRKLFTLGFSKEALMNFMGVEDEDNPDVEEAFKVGKVNFNNLQACVDRIKAIRD